MNQDRIWKERTHRNRLCDADEYGEYIYGWIVKPNEKKR